MGGDAETGVFMLLYLELGYYKRRIINSPPICGYLKTVKDMLIRPFRCLGGRCRLHLLMGNVNPHQISFISIAKGEKGTTKHELK